MQESRSLQQQIDPFSTTIKDGMLIGASHVVGGMDGELVEPSGPAVVTEIVGLFNAGVGCKMLRKVESTSTVPIEERLPVQNKSIYVYSLLESEKSSRLTPSRCAVNNGAAKSIEKGFAKLVQSSAG